MLDVRSVFTILLATLCLAAEGQDFKNLSFDQICDNAGTGLCDWNLSWGEASWVSPVMIDSRHAIEIETPSAQSVSFIEQSILLSYTERIRILNISADIKSADVQGKGTGLNIGVYNDQNVLIATKDMGGFYSVDWITGTSEWSNKSISIIVPDEAAKVKIGMILYGKGKVWFTNFQADITGVEDRTPSKLALSYISAACDTIVRHSLYREAIDIEPLKATALQIAGYAESYRDCHLAINYLLESLRPLGDNHSLFMTATEVKNWQDEGSNVTEIHPPAGDIRGEIGYIEVPPFHGGNPVQMSAYADSLQALIRRFAKADIKGWIIDLRENTGGNMEPMIAGLGPLFSSDKLGALIDVNDDADAWYYSAGKYYWDSSDGMVVSNPVELKSQLPIAVLTSGRTGSSGEIVAISFIGNANTKSFGEPTWGLTTGNGDFDLEDGSRILLSSTIMADRNGKQYTSEITPDVLIADDQTTELDEVVEAAQTWILKSN